MLAKTPHAERLYSVDVVDRLPDYRLEQAYQEIRALRELAQRQQERITELEREGIA